MRFVLLPCPALPGHSLDLQQRDETFLVFRADESGRRFSGSVLATKRRTEFAMATNVETIIPGTGQVIETFEAGRKPGTKNTFRQKSPAHLPKQKNTSRSRFFSLDDVKKSTGRLRW